MFWKDQIDSPIITFRDEIIDNVLREHVKDPEVKKWKLFLANFYIIMSISSFIALAIYGTILGSLFASWNANNQTFTGSAGMLVLYGFIVTFSGAVIGFMLSHFMYKVCKKDMTKTINFAEVYKILSTKVPELKFKEFYPGAWSRSEKSPVKPSTIEGEATFDPSSSFVFLCEFRGQEFEFVVAKWIGGIVKNRMHIRTKAKPNVEIINYVSQLVFTNTRFKDYNGIAVDSVNLSPEIGMEMFKDREDRVEVDPKGFSKLFKTYGPAGAMQLLFASEERAKYIKLFEKFPDVAMDFENNTFKIYFQTPEGFRKRFLHLDDLGITSEELMDMFNNTMLTFLDVFSYYTSLRNVVMPIHVEKDTQNE